MANENKDSLFWPAVIFIVAIAMLGQLFRSDSGQVTTTSYTPDSSSVEHRYVKERIKLEGYSDKESAQAADAIIRFHEAQKARK